MARAVRSLIRADDMLFRWGGDEFMVLMFNLHEGEAERRMRSLNEILERTASVLTSTPMTVSVSFGVSGFSSLKGLGPAIEAADKAMYSSRQVRRTNEVPGFSSSEPAMVN